MIRVIRPLLHGAVAGLAGTTALNIAGYAEIAFRGRPVSETPEITVRTLAEKLHIRIPGVDEVRENRIAGLAPLTGYTVGLCMGAALSVVQAAGWPPTKASRYAFASLFALTVTNAPIMLLGISDPRTWAPSDWVSDIIPHVLFAAVTVRVLEKLEASDLRHESVRGLLRTSVCR
ncbi:hypothetical protein [Streptomyces sp. AM8-1-1]|uniref:hypothetical protein n=1 Tax=Streptomyces sp. AM8-1-1 TaxID=3075825 RepID=UPI0028C4E7C0|nr:hypothetical protein [Streptomyces sp. AM8-1-1]WNO76707.1 hypothetical protein RPQ07_36005 [Streptomyces sp. AM8-1-1]